MARSTFITGMVEQQLRRLRRMRRMDQTAAKSARLDADALEVCGDSMRRERQGLRTQACSLDKDAAALSNAIELMERHLKVLKGGR